jgi:hypothetical protein
MLMMGMVTALSITLPNNWAAQNNKAQRHAVE